MQKLGVPVHVNPAKVHAALGRIEGVVEVEHFHISALTNEKLILTAHLIVAEKAAISAAARDHILERAQHVGKDELEGVVSMTFQITSR